VDVDAAGGSGGAGNQRYTFDEEGKRWAVTLGERLQKAEKKPVSGQRSRNHTNVLSAYFY